MAAIHPRYSRPRSQAAQATGPADAGAAGPSQLWCDAEIYLQWTLTCWTHRSVRKEVCSDVLRSPPSALIGNTTSRPNAYFRWLPSTSLSLTLLPVVTGSSGNSPDSAKLAPPPFPPRTSTGELSRNRSRSYPDAFALALNSATTSSRRSNSDIGSGLSAAVSSNGSSI